MSESAERRGARVTGSAVRIVVALATLLCIDGCSRRGVHPDATFGDTALVDAGAPIDARPATDMGAPRDAFSPIDARPAGDSGRDAATVRDAGSPGGGLDPQLDVPPTGNDVCASPGSLSECPGIAVCRFYSATEGRCESCSACGNLFASCASGEDCDILFVCFQGQCTNFCTLGTSECGAPSDCIDIGHPDRGACRPR